MINCTQIQHNVKKFEKIFTKSIEYYFVFEYNLTIRSDNFKNRNNF